MDKAKVFKTELDWIASPDIRAFTEKCIEHTPDYFFTVPASSTGKYHPEYASGDGGLIRHTKAVCYIAHELLSLEHNQEKFDSNTRDMIISAAILHDSYKYGDVKLKFTVQDHPAIATYHIKELLTEKELPYDLGAIAEMVHTHHGQFNQDRNGNELAPKPATDAQKFLHECDYLASRKAIDIDFGDNWYAGQETIGVQQEIIALCKERISAAKNKESLRAYLYDIIGALNMGEKNPLKIRDIKTAKRVKEAIEQYGDESHASEGTSGFSVIFPSE